MHYEHFWFQNRPNKVQGFLHIHQIFAIFGNFYKYCSTFGTFYFEKSSYIAKNSEKMKKNLPIITIKWPLLESKMFIVQCKQTTDYWEMYTISE